MAPITSDNVEHPLIEMTAADALEGELPSPAELEMLALGAPLDEITAAAAPPLAPLGATEPELPRWYMPSAVGRLGSGWRARVVVGLVFTLLFIEAAGLCTTYGPLG